MTSTKKTSWKLEAGNINNLHQVEEDLESPTVGYVQVEVHAFGLNFADVSAMLGLYEARPPGVFAPGLEVSGRINALPEGEVPSYISDPERKMAIGDKVMGISLFGGYTSHANLPVPFLVPLPEDWTEVDGAGFLVALFTAWYAIMEKGHFKTGETVFIHSIAGGVGFATAELIQHLGGKVIGSVGREEKVKVVTDRFPGFIDASQVIVRAATAEGFKDQLKASITALENKPASTPVPGAWPEGLKTVHYEIPQGVNYAPEHMRDRMAPKGVDLAVDSLLGPLFPVLHDHLNRDGRHIIIGAASMAPSGAKVNWLTLGWKYFKRPIVEPLSLPGQNKTVAGFNLIWLSDKLDMVMNMLARTMVLPWRPPVIGHTYKWADLPDAVRKLQSGTSVGKIVVTTPNAEK